jgi:hypothetical protein
MYECLFFLIPFMFIRNKNNKANNTVHTGFDIRRLSFKTYQHPRSTL